MKFKKLLTAGLVLAMSLTATAGLAACGDPTPPNEENDPPVEHTHTFDTTKWEYDATSHWHPATCEHTDQKGDKARHSFSGRECTVCHYTKAAEVYIEGEIASYPSCNWHTYFTKAGGSITEVREKCIPMQVGEDQKTYTAEVYLAPGDVFAVYEYASAMTYPTTAALDLTKALKVDSANTYLITWVLDEETPSVRVHDHKFTKYVAQGAQHYLQCEDDGTIKEDSYEDHTFENGKCSKCGAAETCTHPNGGVFRYTEETLPEPVETGGTLEKVCPDCGATLTEDAVHYTKGSSASSTLTGSGEKPSLAADEILYSTSGQFCVTLTATKAGVVGLSLEEVYLPDGFVCSVKGISVLYSGSPSAERTILQNRKWQTTGRAATATAAWKPKIAFVGSTPEEENVSALSEIRFTVEESDLLEGKCTFTVALDIYSTETNLNPINYPKSGWLVKAFEEASPAAAAVSALPANRKEN